MRTAVRWLLASVALAGFGAGAAEVALRMLAPALPVGMFTPHPTLGYRLRPHYSATDGRGDTAVAVQINEWGLRDREYGPRDATVRRVYVLGDSFVFGHGVRQEDTITKVAERQIRPPAGVTRVEVVNGGVPRYGTLQELELFRETADTVEPDVVALMVFTGNDALDNLRMAGQGEPAGNPVTRWLRMHSHLYVRLRKWRHGVAGRGDSLLRTAFDVHAAQPLADTQRGLTLTEAAIRDVAAGAHARGAAFVLVLAPAAEQVDAMRWQQAVAKQRRAPTDFDDAEPNRRLAAFAVREQIPVLDLLPALRAQNAESEYFLLHWNARGHAVAGAALADFLTASGVLGAAPQRAGNDSGH